MLEGQLKVGIGDAIYYLQEGGLAYLPSNVPHTFLNLTDKPGGGHKFYEELGPLTRSGSPDRKVVAQLFTKYGMTLLGPPLSPD